ncbi:pyridoxal-phosphate-dependent aminotransferase family protein [Elusimicrobiota bacterium]
MNRKVFFSPMANNLSNRVKAAMVREEISHREPEFTELLQEVRRKIKDLAGGDEGYAVIMFTGSGTAALDSAIGSLSKNSHLAILNNGVYGQRLINIARQYGFHIEEVVFHGYPELTKIEEVMSSTDITHMLMVHHETSSGLLNPLKQIGDMCKKYKKELIVDAISSIAVQNIDVIKDNISFMIGSSNKGIGGAEGLSFIVAKKTELNNVDSRKQSYYLDLRSNYEKQERGQTLFTPAVRIFSGLNEALDELKEETIENRIRRFNRIAEKLRNGLKRLGYEILTDLEHPSNTVTLVNLGNIGYQELYTILKKEGFVIYSSAETTAFRLCTFGDLWMKDIQKFLEALEALK